jgi:hypothetical protein
METISAQFDMTRTKARKRNSRKIFHQYAASSSQEETRKLIFNCLKFLCSLLKMHLREWKIIKYLNTIGNIILEEIVLKDNEAVVGPNLGAGTAQ